MSAGRDSNVGFTKNARICLNIVYIELICSSFDRVQSSHRRYKENLLHFYEIRKNLPGGRNIPDEPKVVKEFRRSAADSRQPKHHELRTPKALKQTVKYLVTDIATDERRPFNFAYDFIFDRLRAVRQETVIQNFNASLTIELLEPIIMFLAYSLYRLAEVPIGKFDPKICRQHLQECLKKVLTCYDVIYADRSRTNVEHMERRAIIESIYLVFNMGRVEALMRALRLPKIVK